MSNFEYRWHFLKQRRGDRHRDPMEGEFFTGSENIDLLQNLVRETIQNSLDAVQRNPDGTPVGPIKLQFSNFNAGEDRLERTRAERYLAGLIPHVQSIPDADVDPSTDVPYLVIEDFGTTGLTGAPEEDRRPDHPNNFFYFFRDTGGASKSGTERGRWGVGKTVFPASSELNSFIGYTVREDDDRKLLMGNSLLKIHEIDDQLYVPDGYLCTPDDEEFQLPIEEDGFLNRFQQDFTLKRNDEPGLSIVIPFPEEQILENFSDRILQASIRYFFQPILAGNLSVNVRQAGGTDRHLNRETIRFLTRNLNWEETGHNSADLGRLFDFCDWSITVREKGEYLQANRTAGTEGSPASVELSELFDEEVIEDLSQNYLDEERIALRIPVMVKFEDERDSIEAHFDIFLQYLSGMEHAEDHYIREGLTIPENDAISRNASCLGMVVVDHPDLSALVGDAENPQHTFWKERNIDFRQDYRHGPTTVSFVKKSLKKALEMLTRSDKDIDYSLLDDIFFITREQGRGGSTTTPDTPEESRVCPFVANALSNGFAIRLNDEFEGDLDEFYVRAAYHVNRGNPFKKHHPSDFDFSAGDIDIDLSGAEIIETRPNVILCRVTDSDAKISIKGFDSNRDVRIDYDERKPAS